MLEQFYNLKSNYTKGASLIEMVLALALLSLILVSVLGAEWAVRDLAYGNLQLLSAGSQANRKLIDFQGGEIPTSSVVDANFNTSEVSKLWPFTKCQYFIDHKTAWRTSRQNTSIVTTSLLMSDLELSDKYKHDCGGHPKKFVAGDLRLIDAIDLNYSVTAVDVVNDSIYATLRPTGQISPDLVMIPSSSLRSPRSINVGLGLNKVDATSDNVFVAHNSSTTQMMVVRINSVQDIELVASSTLPNVAGVRPEAVSLFYFASKVYIGTKRTAGHEFHIFDVSDPFNPRWLGSKEVNHNINEIVVKDGFAFLATSGNVRDLIILNVNNPARITTAIEVDLPGNEDGKTVNVFGNIIFLGRHRGLVPGHNELQILRYSIDTNTGFIEVSLIDSALIGYDINALTYAGGYLFVSTSHPLKEIQFFEYRGDGDLRLAGYLNLPATSTGIDYENGNLFISAGNFLYIYEQN